MPDNMDDMRRLALASILATRRMAMARRRFQHGQLTEETDRWVIRWREDVVDPITNETRRVRRWDVLPKVLFPTKRLAQRELASRLDAVNSDNYRPKVLISFARFAAKWEETILVHRKPSARDGSILRVHLIPAFGNLLLHEITAERLQAWVSSHKAQPKTVDNIVVTLRSLWKTAKAWGYAKHDPFEGLVLPKKLAPNTYAFTLEESIAIIEHAKEPWKTLFRIVAETGVRSGEVAGLRVKDFDPINLTLAVRQSVWNKTIQTPKTANSVRREPISQELAEAIKSVIVNAKKNDYGLIFTGQTGEPLQMIHFANRVFRPILQELGIRDKLAKLGITRCGLHAFRRMNGTQMDEQGVPLKTRQARMGHASPTTTMIHYTKPIEEASRRFADRMGALLTPKKDGEAVQ